MLLNLWKMFEKGFESKGTLIFNLVFKEIYLFFVQGIFFKSAR